MLKEERHQCILDLLARDGRVHATELSAQLGVSEDTIRRDLVELAEADLCRRVHGGALARIGVPRNPFAFDFAKRLEETNTAKEAIAQAALPLLHANMVVILDGGTTTLSLARQLPQQMALTVITNSPAIATVLAGHPLVDVILLGGHLLKAEQVTAGPATLAALAEIHADLCFLGICSLHPQLGITSLNYEEAFVKRAMLAQATTRVALASTAKVGTASPFVVAPVTALTHIVTERALPNEGLLPYQEQGIVVMHGNLTGPSQGE